MKMNIMAAFGRRDTHDTAAAAAAARQLGKKKAAVTQRGSQVTQRDFVL